MNAVNPNLTPWVTEKFISAAPLAASKALESLATHEALLLLKPLKAEMIVLCLNPMQAAKAAAILRRLPSRQSAHILSRLDLRQAAKVFASFSAPQRDKMKSILPSAFISALEGCGRWPSGSAGAVMKTDFLAFKTEAKLSDMIDKLKTLPRKKLPTACLVISKDGRLKGLIRTAELAFYAPVCTTGSVMTEAGSVKAEMLAEKAAELLQQGQPLVPVTDENGIVMGVLDAEIVPARGERKKRFGWF